MFDDKFSKKKSLLLAQCHMYDASSCTNTIRFTIMYAHVYRYIYVHIARTHERLALQWHTIYSEEKWAKYFKNEKRSKKWEFLIVNIENGGKREFWWSARRMKVVWKGGMAIQVTKGHTQRAFINSTIGNDNDTVNIYIYVGTLAMKIQRHICFNTIVTQRLLLHRASKFSILPSLVSSSFSLFLFFCFPIIRTATFVRG